MSSKLDAGIARAQQLRNRGEYDAACQLLRAALGASASAEDCYRVALFIKQTRREHWAYEVCEQALARGSRTPQLLALSGSLAQSMGRFERARTHLLAAWHAGIDLNEWQVLPALAHTLRYTDSQHPDRALLESALATSALSPTTRAALHFALGKLHDDCGEPAQAVTHWRGAHAAASAVARWDAARWQQRVRLAQWVEPIRRCAPAPYAPVLIVGLPRSGTTVLAEQLARGATLVNRGEMPFLLYVHDQLAGQTWHGQEPNEGRALWLVHLRQDDMPAKSHYIDKNPLNLLALETAFALCAETRVIWCHRDQADNALSLWSQSFAHADYAFSHRFEDIARVQDDCTLLRQHAHARWPDRVIDLDYAQLVQTPEATLREVFAHLGIDPPAGVATTTQSAIGSASLWQARQPVHARSLGRAHDYRAWIPELDGFLDC
ncbi:sulfotransferase family protein [Metallibacterium sp.]